VGHFMCAPVRECVCVCVYVCATRIRGGQWWGCEGQRADGHGGRERGRTCASLCVLLCMSVCVCVLLCMSACVCAPVHECVCVCVCVCHQNTWWSVVGI